MRELALWIGGTIIAFFFVLGIAQAWLGFRKGLNALDEQNKKECECKDCDCKKE